MKQISGYVVGPIGIVEILKQKRRALRVQELAELLQVSKQQIYKEAAAGRIPYFRVAGAIRFDPVAIRQWLTQRHTKVVIS
jgi:excisionase family DNA binding protein